MKLVIDERIKHRLTGMVVIVSLAVIFLPVLMKSSNHRLDENIRVSLKLPHKPALPDVVIPKQEVMFGELNVAHVDLPSLPATKSVDRVAKAKSLIEAPPKVQLAQNVQVAIAPSKIAPSKIDAPTNIVPVKKVVAVKAPVITTPVAVKTTTVAVKKSAYAVQLAAFSQQNNANALVASLRKQGFEASAQKVNGRRGVYYQVLVGKLDQKNAAMNLQKQLVHNTRLNGFVVQTAVG
jgi:DedD protein